MSEVLNNLKKRVAEIENGLGIDLTLDYDKIDSYQEVTKAYILLIHSELEKYFEVISVKIAKDCFSEYKKTNLIRKPLLSLASTNIYSFSKPESFFETKHKEEIDLTKRISKFVNKYICYAKSNNGIKNKDIFLLLWSLGFSEEEIGSNLLMLLDAFGSKRGKIAHTGDSFNKQILNYIEEKNNVNKLLAELEKFDKIVDNYNYLSDKSNINDIENILFSTNSSIGNDEKSD